MSRNNDTNCRMGQQAKRKGVKYEKFISALLSLLIICNITTTAFASNLQESALVPTTDEMIQELDIASQKLAEGTINNQEYDSILLNIYKIRSNNSTIKKLARSSDYYPEVQAGYINYDGVVYLYTQGLKNAATANAAISLLMSALPGAGWGLGLISVVSAYGGKSSLELAVNRAYASKKGIIIYYKIHKSITSLNTVRYVVG